MTQPLRVHLVLQLNGERRRGLKKVGGCRKFSANFPTAKLLLKISMTLTLNSHIACV